jgi:multidrug efflux pump subunit AcrB
VDYSVVYDPTVFVRHSIEAVVHTLLEATLLVVICRHHFSPDVAGLDHSAGSGARVARSARLPSCWRSDFSINNLSLFGLVLAIGIVVDDAIVVVENVERNIALGLSPADAAKRAMSEVTSPIIATALVLVRVFIPTAFISGSLASFTNSSPSPSPSRR